MEKYPLDTLNSLYNFFAPCCKIIFILRYTIVCGLKRAFLIIENNLFKEEIFRIIFYTFVESVTSRIGWCRWVENKIS